MASASSEGVADLQDGSIGHRSGRIKGYSTLSSEVDYSGASVGISCSGAASARFP